MKQILIGVIVLTIFSSCGKTCDKQRGFLPANNLKNIAIAGEYSVGDASTEAILTKKGDTATITYTRNGTTYTLYYTVKDEGMSQSILSEKIYE